MLYEVITIGYDQVAPLVAEYMRAAQSGSGSSSAVLDVRTPTTAPETSMLVRIIGPIMGGTMIFYAFFTGMSTGESILREEEEGTLARLFTTPRITSYNVCYTKLLRAQTKNPAGNPDNGNSR